MEEEDGEEEEEEEEDSSVTKVPVAKVLALQGQGPEIDPQFKKQRKKKRKSGRVALIKPSADEEGRGRSLGIAGQPA